MAVGCRYRLSRQGHTQSQLSLSEGSLIGANRGEDGGAQLSTTMVESAGQAKNV